MDQGVKEIIMQEIRIEGKVDINSYQEIKEAANQFCVSRERLLSIISKVGARRKKIQKYIGKRFMVIR